MEIELAPEGALVNLVSGIPKEKRAEIAKRVCDQYNTDVDSRSDWEKKREKWYKLWACMPRDKDSPWEGASNVCVPLLASACNQFHGRSYQSIFAPPGIMRALPVAENDVKRARDVENFMNWQILYDIEEYEEVFDKLLQLLPLNGTAFKKIYWHPVKDRPVVENIEALDVVVPYRTRNLEDARRITHRIWLHYDEMVERDEQGLYEDFDRVQEGPSHEDESELQGTADEVAGISTGENAEKPHLILECHERVDIGDGRKPYIFTVDYDSKTLLRATSRTFQGKEMHYFVDYHFLPNPHGFYSFGFGHFLEPLIEMVNTAFNQIFDAGSLSNMPFGFYGRRAGIRKRKIKLFPGMMQEVEDASQVFFPSMQRVDQVLFMFLQQAQQYIEQFTSTSDYISGRESKGTKTPTAHGTLAIIEQGLVTFAVMTKRIFRSLRKELRILMGLNQLYLPDELEYRIMGNANDIAFADVKRAEFDSVKDVMPTGDPSYASKMSRRQEATELYGILMGNPLVVGNPELGMQPNMEAMHAALSGVIDAYDRKDKSLLLPKLPEKQRLPEYENAMFMQGDYEEPKPGENHQEHFQKHIAFMQGPLFANLPPEYQALVQKHLEATQAVAYMESQQMQQIGGEPQ